MSIYRVDDGAIWHIDAEDHADVRRKWVGVCLDQGYVDEAAVLADFDAPRIARVQLTAAARIKIRDEEHRAACPTCGTPDAVEAERSLLEVWQENQALPEEKRARHGVLCCSEW